MPEFAINHQNSSRQSSYRGLASVGSHVVLVSPLRSSLGPSGTHDHLAVVDIRHPDAVESTLAKIVGEGDLPVVTCAEPDAEAVRRLLTFAAVRYPGFRACLEPLPGSPLAVGVISSLVDDLDGGPENDANNWRALSGNPFAMVNFYKAVKNDGDMSVNTYSQDPNTYGINFGGDWLGEYGESISGDQTTKALTDSLYWDGTQLVKRPDC